MSSASPRPNRSRGCAADGASQRPCRTHDQKPERRSRAPDHRSARPDLAAPSFHPVSCFRGRPPNLGVLGVLGGSWTSGFRGSRVQGFWRNLRHLRLLAPVLAGTSHISHLPSHIFTLCLCASAVSARIRSVRAAFPAGQVRRVAVDSTSELGASVPFDARRRSVEMAPVGRWSCFRDAARTEVWRGYEICKG